MFKVSEGNVSLQLQRFLQFVPVTGSRELEGKEAKGGVGFANANDHVLPSFVIITQIKSV